ncbi:PssE/Cps14G family polysaccharide biosynthesis glycosyltransferase [Ectobacillus antri]|uniref:PssE/Cps14G family polysaccharide biosynthesis glycosyltransferase n=1 Tax=Ectobacillus antri TaxID=2486280 RepID=A0ABT6H9K9_9BACI|nr:PssE/Cps14G family polysaccharide biosynthesis glycosyltransferase [Ectobacillus antri]MDG4658481.1 PssE/Cps14G family polysaccharide biosynthesis glycosyltransferase [Ectobacillus antri]MDG5755493.1 PssE/Cps14G family polysaccharide biosynthesis glycosyltransferase [Ectobacillus antri]
MIFVTVGSQKFQFNRLLEEIDRLVEEHKIGADEVFAQIGYSTYQPRLYRFQKFLNKEEFLEKIEACTIIITHGGTGSIINGVKRGKKVIGIPRMMEYGEHVDNHQFEIIEQFANSNMIYSIVDIKELEEALVTVTNLSFRKYESNTENIINILNEYLLKEVN